MTPTFLRHIVSAIYRPPFGKVWLSSVYWSPSAKPGNEMECRIYGGWVKTHLQFEAVSGPKFMLFWDDLGDPSWFATHLPAYVCRVSFRRYRRLNLPSCCEMVKKGGFGSQICRGKGYPTFQTCIFKSQLLSTICMVGYGWLYIWLTFVQRAPRVAGEKNERRRKNPW